MRKGFTLIEIIVVMFIMIVAGIVAVTSLSTRRRAADLTTAAQELGSVLREAQSRSMAESQGDAWGVHLANTTGTAPFYALFSTAYSSATVIAYYRLPSTVQYTTSTLASGSSTDIIFSAITGAASASTTIGLNLISTGNNAAVSVASSGAISY